MEGLIKGLIDVTIGHNADHHDDDHNTESIEERSRSTWAQVTPIAATIEFLSSSHFLSLQIVQI